MALMDPYGLELFAVEWWGVVLGVTSTGFIIGGIVVARFGLGRNPIRTMLLLVMVMGLPSKPSRKYSSHVSLREPALSTQTNSPRCPHSQMIG